MTLYIGVTRGAAPRVASTLSSAALFGFFPKSGSFLPKRRTRLS